MTRKSAGKPARTPAAQSRESTLISSRVPFASAVSSATVGGSRAAISPSGASTSTSTLHARGRRASICATCAAGSKSGSGGTAGPPIEAYPIRSARKGTKLVTRTIARGHVPAAPAHDEPEGVDLARARRAVVSLVADQERPLAADGLRDEQQRLARGRSRVGLAGELELGVEALDTPRQPVGEYPGDLRQRTVGAAEPALLGKHQADHDCRRLLVRQHQGWKARPRTYALATAQAWLTVDRIPRSWRETA